MRFDIEERLIDYSCAVISVAKFLPNDTTGTYLENQLIRSSLSCALNYGEALSAESRRDFIHKNKLVLKELRESFVAIKIIEKLKIVGNVDRLKYIHKETNELISIFHSSIRTAEKNSPKK